MNCIHSDSILQESWAGGGGGGGGQFVIHAYKFRVGIFWLEFNWITYASTTSL